MKTLFISAGDESWGSSRLRAYWPAKYMEDAAVVTIQSVEASLPLAEAYIWQKSINVNYLIESRQKGILNFWDVCDPLWWWTPNEVKAIAPQVDGMVFSSTPLMDDFKAWALENDVQTPVYCIPDRMDLAHYPIQRQHANVQPVRLIWFGLSINRMGLFGAFGDLERLVCNGHQIELTIFDDRPGDPMEVQASFPIYYSRWSLGHENAIIASHDIAILPPYPGSWGKVKSNNRQLTAWACGLPVNAGDYNSLRDLIEQPDLRQQIAESRTQERPSYNIKQSAREWENLLCQK